MKTLRELAEEGQDAWETLQTALACGHKEIAEQANEKWCAINEQIKNREYVD